MTLRLLITFRIVVLLSSFTCAHSRHADNNCVYIVTLHLSNRLKKHHMYSHDYYMIFTVIILQVLLLDFFLVLKTILLTLRVHLVLTGIHR